MTTLNELIERLTDLRERIADERGIDADDAGAETSIVVASQPNYPLIGELVNVTAASFLNDDDDDAEQPFTVYLGVDTGDGYGNGWMFDNDGEAITVCADCEAETHNCDCDEDDE